VTLTVTGFFTFRVYYFFTDTITFTGTTVLTPAPSGDAGQPSRILSVTTGATSLTTTTTGPSPTLATWGWFPSLIAPAVVANLQRKIEAAINDLLDGLVAPGLASLSFLRSLTSVLSARNVTITSSGMALLFHRGAPPPGRGPDVLANYSPSEAADLAGRAGRGDHRPNSETAVKAAAGISQELWRRAPALAGVTITVALPSDEREDNRGPSRRGSGRGSMPCSTTDLREEGREEPMGRKPYTPRLERSSGGRARSVYE
jgi:hypothetical protein